MATELEINAAKVKRDNAYASIAPAKASMDSWYNLMTKCKIKSEDKYLVLGEPAEGTCQTGSAGNHPGCAAKETCQSNMAQYNLSVSNWETANSNYEIAQEEYELLKGEKSETEEGEAERDAAQIRTSYYVFGFIALVVIVAGVFVWMKYKKK